MLDASHRCWQADLHWLRPGPHPSSAILTVRVFCTAGEFKIALNFHILLIHFSYSINSKVSYITSLLAGGLALASARVVS